MVVDFLALTLSADNRVARLSVTAADEADARAQLARRGLFVASLQARRPAFRLALPAGRGAALRFDLTLFSQELLALLRAGLGVVEALEALAEKEARPQAAAVLARLLAGLREGQRLSVVLAAQPAVFPPLFVGMVRTAEGTSDLPHALERFVAYDQRVSAVRGKLVSASIYPAILLAVGGAVTLFLIGWVVPRFAEVLQGSGRPLPWLSQQLLLVGQWLSAHALVVLGGGGAALALAVVGVRRLLQRVGVVGLLGRVPGLGVHLRIVELSRLYLTLGMLVEGGIPLAAAMEIVQGIVSPGLRAGLEAGRQRIEEGQPLSGAFERAGLTTPISLRLLRVGERTGNLGPLLMQAAAFHDGETGRWIDRFTRAVEPLLMAVIGIVVGVIVVLLYMPIFDLAGGL